MQILKAPLKGLPFYALAGYARAKSGFVCLLTEPQAYRDPWLQDHSLRALRAREMLQELMSGFTIARCLSTEVLLVNTSFLLLDCQKLSHARQLLRSRIELQDYSSKQYAQQSTEATSMA